MSHRLRQIPGFRDWRRFFVYLARPTRSSAIRGSVDGAYVAWTLRRRGVRPLMVSGQQHWCNDSQRAIKVAGAVDAGLGLLPISATCLRRSLTLLRELGRLKLAATLHIGVRHVERRLEAHAWVQVGSVVVNDDANEIVTYTELAGGELERILPMLR